MASTFSYDDFAGGASPAASPPPSAISYDDFASAGAPTTAGGVAADVAKSAGSGVVRGVVGAPFAPASIAKMGADSILDAGDWAVRKMFGLGPASDEWKAKQAKAAAAIKADSVVPSPLDVGDAAQQALTPYLHAPETTAGKYAETTGEFLPMIAAGPETLAGMGTVGGAAKTLAGGVVAPAVGSEAAGQVTQGTAVEPYARLAGGIAGGAAAHGLGSTVNAVSDVAAPVVAKGLAVVGASGMQEKLAGKQLLAASSDPAAFRAALDQPSPEIVPGSAPTTFQLTGDAGVGQLERGDRTANPAPYIERAQAQNVARQDLLQSVTPIGDPSAVPTFLQSQLDQIDQDHQAKIRDAQSLAQDRASQIGSGDTPDAIGNDLRSQTDAAYQDRKAQEAALHQAVDPDGTLGVDMSAVKAKADDLYGNMTQAGRANITPQEQGFVDLLNGYQPTESYREAADFKSSLAGEMRAARANPQTRQAYQRMSRLMGPVQDAINGAVTDRAADEAWAVSAGTMSPDDTMASRLRWGTDAENTGEPAGVGARAASDAVDFPGDRPPANTGGLGAENEGAGGRGPAPSDQSLPGGVGSGQAEAPRPVTPAHQGPLPQSLITFIQRNGGIRKSQAGDLIAAGFDRHPGLITNNGVPIDRMRESAAEAGYLGADTAHAVQSTDVNDMLDAIGSHPTYSVHDQDAVANIAQRAKEVAHQKDFAAARKTIADGLKRDYQFKDSDFDQSNLNKAAHIAMEENLSPLDAYELALRRSSEQDEAQRAATRAEFGDIPFDDLPRSADANAGGARDAQARNEAPAGRGPGAPYADGPQLPSGGAGQAQGGVRYRLPTEADSANIRAAAAATKDIHQTFNEGPMKAMMAPGPRAGEYKLPDHAVPAQVLRNGPAGYQTVKTYLKAAGDTPEATEAVKGAISAQLRDKIGADGTLPAGKLAGWKNRYTHALRAIDEASPGFSSKFDSAASATDELTRAGLARDQARKDFQNGAVGKVIGAGSQDEVVNRLGTALGGADRVSQMRDLAAQVKDNPAALAGLRNGVAEWMSRRFTSTMKAGAAGEAEIKPNEFVKLVRERAPALREVLDQPHLEALDLVARDLDREAASYQGSKLKASPGTAQDLHQAAASGHGHGTPGSFLGAVMAGALAGEHVPFFDHIGPLGGGALGGGAYLANKLRGAGIRDIQHLVSDALLNPERARQYVKRVSPNNERERRIAGLVQKSFIQSPKDEPSGLPPLNEPPPTGPFSRGGAGSQALTSGAWALSSADARGRIEPILQKPEDAAPQPNVPLAGRQARLLRAAGYEPAEIGGMSSQDRAKALRNAEGAGFIPSGRITPAERSAMGGALPHIAFDGRSGDGRFAGRGDLLDHPDINGRVEPTWHPDADATHQAILAHEQRLKGIASKLAPDASIADVKRVTGQAADDALAMVRAYHGTPHDVDRFDLGKIGTGEGRQVYGHGLYFAENQKVGEEYRRQLSRDSGGNLYHVAIDREPEHFVDWDKPYAEQSPHVQERLRALDDQRAANPPPPEPLGQSARNVLDALKADPKYRGKWDQDEDRAWHYARKMLPGWTDPGIASVIKEVSAVEDKNYRAPTYRFDEQPDTVGRLLARKGMLEPEHSKAMSKSGIAGVRYLDAGSRDGAGEGTRNYVVFNDKDIKITHRNGQPVSDEVRDELLPKMRSASADTPSAASSTASLRDMLTRPGAVSGLDQANASAVGDRITKLAGDTPVRTVSREQMRDLAGGRIKLQPGTEPAGFYDPKAGHIVALDEAMSDPKEASRLMLHEGLHAALYRTIKESPAAQNVIDHIRETAAAAHLERGGAASDHYGLTNAHEFVSEAFSNPEFQRFLASIPADNRLVRAFGLQDTAGRTMWDAFTAAVRKILGFTPGQHSLLDAAMKVGGHLLDKADAERAPRSPALNVPPAAFVPRSLGLSAMIGAR